MVSKRKKRKDNKKEKEREKEKKKRKTGALSSFLLHQQRMNHRMCECHTRIGFFRVCVNATTKNNNKKKCPKIDDIKKRFLKKLCQFMFFSCFLCGTKKKGFWTFKTSFLKTCCLVFEMEFMCDLILRGRRRFVQIEKLTRMILLSVCRAGF